MKTQYLVLNSFQLKGAQSAAADIFGAPSPAARSAGAGAATVSGISATVRDISFDQVATLTARANTLAVAPVVPMKLVAPVMRRAGGAAGAPIASAWGISAVGADDTPYAGAGVVVAVLDTGIDASHPAFAGVELVEKDFTGEGLGDNNGHGTHCAGTIFGRPVNGYPIGVAPGVNKAIIAKVLDANGSGSSESIVKGLLWAVEEGAHIISMSIGMDFPGMVADLVARNWPVDLATSRALEAYRTNTRLFDSLAAMVASGGLADQHAVIIAAAGNESKRDVHPDYEIAVAPPAVAAGVISVGALALVNGKFATAAFSNTGPNLAGPGVDILSASVGGGLEVMSGTSMAAPHVAGVAALWAEKLMQGGSFTDFQLVARLAGTARDDNMAAGSQAVDYGAGMVRCPAT